MLLLCIDIKHCCGTIAVFSALYIGPDIQMSRHTTDDLLAFQPCP